MVCCSSCGCGADQSAKSCGSQQLTLSGASRSAMAVPSARNSGLLRISKWIDESVQFRLSTCTQQLLLSAVQRALECRQAQWSVQAQRHSCRLLPANRGAEGVHACLLNGLSRLHRHRGLLNHDLGRLGHAGNHARRLLPVGQVCGLASAHASRLGGRVDTAGLDLSVWELVQAEHRKDASPDKDDVSLCHVVLDLGAELQVAPVACRLHGLKEPWLIDGQVIAVPGCSAQCELPASGCRGPGKPVTHQRCELR